MALVVGSCYAQPLYVEAPDVTPLPHGLFSIATILSPEDPHWQTGIEYEPLACGPASVYACPTCVQNNNNTAPAKTYEEGVPLTNGFPFTVYGSFKCSPVGNWDRGFERAADSLRAGEERAVESAIATGDFHGGVSLTGADAIDITPTPGTPVNLVQGIALLEQYVGANGSGQGAILGSRRDLILANANGVQVWKDGEMLRTLLGTPVAGLAGFDGRTGPNDDAAGAGQAWLFGLGSTPVIRRSEIFMTPEDRRAALNTGTNDFEVLAERTYVVTWDCFTAAVLVTSI